LPKELRISDEGLYVVVDDDPSSDNIKVTYVTSDGDEIVDLYDRESGQHLDYNYLDINQVTKDNRIATSSQKTDFFDLFGPLFGYSEDFEEESSLPKVFKDSKNRFIRIVTSDDGRWISVSTADPHSVSGAMNTVKYDASTGKSERGADIRDVISDLKPLNKKEQSSFKKNFYTKDAEFPKSYESDLINTPVVSQETKDIISSRTKLNTLYSTPSEAADAFRTQLATKEAAAMETMANRYLDILGSMEEETKNLIDRMQWYSKKYNETLASIEAVQANTSLTAEAKEMQLRTLNEQLNMYTLSQGRMLNLAETLSLTERAQDAYNAFVGDDYLPMLFEITDGAVAQGVADATRMMELTFPGDVGQMISSSFSRPNENAIRELVGILSPDSPYFAGISKAYGEAAAKNMSDTLFKGMVNGMDNRKIARQIRANMQSAAGESLDWVQQSVRTAQAKAYNRASTQTYRDNSDVVKGWVWYANLSTACVSCIRMHGTVHSVDEELNDHHAGQCVAVPETYSWSELGVQGLDDLDPPAIETGEEWFARQSDAKKVSLLGYAKFDMYERGDLSFDKLAKVYDDPTWGTLVRPTTAKELSNYMYSSQPKDIDFPEIVGPSLIALNVFEGDRGLTPFTKFGDVEDNTHRELILGLTEHLPPDVRLKSRITLSNMPSSDIIKIRDISLSPELSKSSAFGKFSKLEPEDDALFGFKAPDGRIGGAFANLQTGEILIPKEAFFYQPSTFVHEAGHVVSVSKIFGDEERFGKVLDVSTQMQQKLPNDKLASVGLRSYSKTNIDELIADTYSVHIMGSDEQKKNLAQVFGVNSLDEIFGE